MKIVAYERRRTRVFVVAFIAIVTKYWTRGIPYKFDLFDRPKIRSFGRFAIMFFGHIQIRIDLWNWKKDTSRYQR